MSVIRRAAAICVLAAVAPLWSSATRAEALCYP